MRFIILTLAFCFSQAIDAHSTFSLVNRTIAPGSVQSWMQPVSSTQLPITVVHGQYAGPVLLLTAGIHGDEFPPVFAMQKLSQTINPETLRGTLIIVHLANLEGFHGRRIALSPIDEKNLNRVFPGDADGTLTEQVADFMTIQLIPKANYVIDIHSGSWNQSLLPHVYSPVMNSEPLDKQTLDFALSLGIPHIVLYNERPNDPDHSISFPNTAQTRGKPALTLEVGQLGQKAQADIDLIYAACMNALKYFNMYGNGSKATSNPIVYRKLISIESPQTGIFHPQVKVGDEVKQGQAIGWVSDYFGRQIVTLHSTLAGTVLMQKETPPIRQGETTTDIGIR